jgi:organic radical activating enzyme
MKMIEPMSDFTDRQTRGAIAQVPERALLPVVETFHSIQGEGLWVGCSAFFIRLAGCDVGCPWCDTKHSWDGQRYPQRAIADLVAEAVACHPAFVVVTGGEPLLHDLTHLTQSLHNADLRLHLETAGAHPFSGQFDWVTLSPKQLKPPHPELYSQANELKVVIQTATDFEWAEQQAQRVNPSVVKLLQPEWTTPDSLKLVYAYVRQHPQWRISLQTHKFMHVR